MSHITLITGGARSGKSSFAEKILDNEDSVLYIATAIPFDDEMKDRIKKHKVRRNSCWELCEIYKNFDQQLPQKIINKKYILFDCLTIMISNLMTIDHDCDWDSASAKKISEIEKNVADEVNKLLKIIENYQGKVIIVTNEIGMGVVPPTPLGRHFRDIAGRINQKIARIANEVILMVSGINVKIK